MLVFSQDGARLFFESIAGPEPRIESWSTESWTRISDDVTDAELIARIGGTSGVRLRKSDCFSPDGSIRARAGSPGNAYLVVNGRRRDLPEFPRISSFAFSPDGRILAVSSEKEQAIRLISTASLREFRRVEVGLIPRALAFSPDGKRLAVVGFSNVIRLFDTERWQPVVDLRGHTATIHDVRFSPDGRSLATASSDRTVRIWTTIAPPAG